METSPKYAGVEVRLNDEEHNSFDTISAVRRALMQAGVPFIAATEYTDKAMRASTYEELLRITRETVAVT